MNDDKHGLIALVIAFSLWGALPIYWKLLQHVDPMEILCHRILWALIFLLILILLQKTWSKILTIVRVKKNVAMLFVSSILVGANWFLYIWSVNNGQILQSSLGYYINPILNVTLGIFLFKEKLSILQWVAVGLAFIGVAFLTWQNGVMPSLALAIAFTFCIYGALHKFLAQDAIVVLMLETLVLAIPSLIYLMSKDQLAFGLQDLTTSALLAGSGVITAVPLLLFVYAADKVRFTTLGLIQYLAPTGQFICGIIIFHEPFELKMKVTFALIWTALFLYSFSKFQRRQKRVTYS